MNKQREALELALKAIGDGGHVEDMMAAEKAIQEALAELEQKPVAHHLRDATKMPQPLADEAIHQLFKHLPSENRDGWVVAFARAIEKAHGIGGEA